MSNFLMRFISILLGTNLVFFTLMGNSWPNWLGPNFDGSIEESLSGFEDLQMEWQKNVGEGWSAPVISDKTVFLHDRSGDVESLTAYDLLDGKEKWRYSFESNYRDDFGMEKGPRSTPAVANGILLSHNPEGKIHALSSEKGKLIWTRDLQLDFGSSKGFFGRCSSPLILGGKVFFDVGGERAGLIALELNSGKTLWKSTSYGNDYASVVPLLINNTLSIVAFMREGLVVLNAGNGSELFFESFQSPINASVNAATPLVLKNGIFLSSCYEVGAGYWIFSSGKSGKKIMNLWRKKGVLDCHYSTPVQKGDFIFGFHGRQERGSLLRCIRLSDGEVMWTAPSMGTGHLIRIGDHILCLTEVGELIVFKAKSEGFEIEFRQQVLGAGRSHFAYSDGKVVARDKRRLVCLKWGNGSDR